MEAFDAPVLCGRPGLNVNRPDASLDAPGEVVPAAYLGPIIRTKKLSCAALANDVLQHSCRTLARQTGIGFKRQTFAREGVHNAEDTQPRPARRHMAGEIDRPFLIWSCQDGRRGI